MKRLFDVLSSLSLLLILAPVFLLVALWIKWSDPGPILFVQERIGQFGRPFALYKFRTMTHDPSSQRRLLTSDEDNYITRPGVCLRNYKLDELPQLINIVFGRMSVVGPRPEVKKYIDCYSTEDRELVLSVKPGLTDFAAIEYRNESEILALQPNPEEFYISDLLPRKIELYKKYVKERSLLVDIKIIFSTLRSILGR